MNNFVYIAQDLAGREKKGLKRGSSQHEVYTWLQSHGLIPLEVKLQPVSASKNIVLFQKPPKSSEIAAFCWQLSTMLEGGILITEALDIIAEDITNLSFRQTLLVISNLIKEGEHFSAGTSRYPKTFNKLFNAMILAGESSGSLPTILVRLAEYYDTRDKFTKKVKSALAYPIFVIAFVVIILIVMMTLIIPRFQAIFETMGGKIPPFTQGFMNVYDILTANITYVSVGTLIFAFLIFAYSRTRSGHYRLSAIFLSVPLLGTLISQAFVATFCKTMSTLLSAGVSVVEAFDILSEMSSNELIKNAVFDSKQGVIEGANLSSAMARTGFFPNMVSRMVEVGEKSGSLPKVFDRSSHYYETKMDATITTLLSCLGPIVIVLVGGIVMVVIIALYLPIFSMSDFNT